MSPVKRNLSSKIVLEPKNLLITAKSAASFNLTKNQDIYSEAKKVTSINFSSATTNFVKTLDGKRLSLSNNRQNKKENLLKPEVVLKIEKSKPSNGNTSKPLYRPNRNALRDYKKHYNSLIDKSIDPMNQFQISIGKESFDQQRKGIKGLESGTRNLANQSKSLLLELQRQISQISSTRYEFKKVVNSSRYKILECVGRISLDDLEVLGRKAYVLYVAKDSSGINLQAQEYAIQINEVLKQRINQSVTAQCSVSRNNAGVSKLLVSNMSSKKLLDVDIEAKNLKRQTNFLESKYNELISNKKIQPSSGLSVVDGVENSKTKRAIKFNPTDNLFFRATLNYRDRKYNNSFCASLKGVKGTGRNDNIPNLNVVATLSDNNRGINVQISGVSDNITAVKLVKYKYKGSSKGKMLETFDLEGNVNQFVFLNSENKDDVRPTLNFFDSDVFQDRVYMYTVECIMSNGERKLATDYSIEKFEERTETVLISEINVDTPDFITGASNQMNEEQEATRSVAIKFKISKIQTEVDKVISNLFGNLFDIYEDELKKIKDVQGLVYSIEIQRIEVQTGDSVTVGKITADVDGNCSFTDEEAPAFSDLIYKLVPRVRPANEVITSIVAQTPFLAKKTISQPVNFVSSAARINARNRKDRVFTAKKDKFNDRNMFKRGRIRSPKNILEQNSEDLFADSSTGDIFYVNVGGLSENRFYDSIDIFDGNIEEIKHPTSLTTDSYNIALQEKYCEVSFVTNNDYLVDFYILLIKESNRIYVDGAIHSSDTISDEKDYKYLVRHVGSRGVVEYYAVPVLKNGRVLRPKLISAQLIR